MVEEILTVVRLPLAELSEEIKRRHKLSEALVDSRIEGDVLVMYFSKTARSFVSNAAVNRGAEISRQVRSETTGIRNGKRTRRARGKRNRMKTRGWPVVGHIVNSRAQTAVVYKPFVDALKGKHLTPSQQKAVVTQILRAN